MASSAGIELQTQAIATTRDRTFDLALVCAGFHAERYRAASVLNWLRRHDRLGSKVGAVSTGTFVLARAGLLARRRCTVHWDFRSALAELYPDLDLVDELAQRAQLAGGLRERATVALGARHHVPHVHPYAPDHPALYQRVGDEYLFTADPVPFGYEGPKTTYYGHHPLLLSAELGVAPPRLPQVRARAAVETERREIHARLLAELHEREPEVHVERQRREGARPVGVDRVRPAPRARVGRARASAAGSRPPPRRPARRCRWSRPARPNGPAWPRPPAC